MTKNSLTASKFASMLEWLNADRDDAIRKYEKIYHRLIEILASRGCHEAEDLADEIIDRVVNKIDEVSKNYEGDPASYFYGVAKNVLFEYWKRKSPSDLPYLLKAEDTSDSDEKELRHAILDDCLALLSEEDRDLILNYYQKEGREKILYRTEIASKLGIALNALRIRVYRIRIGLKDCVRNHTALATT
jgi:RNA polymerase sigma factor (sigma-70 family)